MDIGKAVGRFSNLHSSGIRGNLVELDLREKDLIEKKERQRERETLSVCERERERSFFNIYIPTSHSDN